MEDYISLLKYNKKWIDYGFLSRVDLEDQIVEYNKGEDPFTEHYRYRTFLRFIEKRSRFTNEEIDKFIELVRLDDDQGMSSSALAKLVQSEKLSKDQYIETKKELLKYGEWTKKIVDRIDRKLDNN